MARDVTGPTALEHHADDPQNLPASDDDGRRYWKARRVRRFEGSTAPAGEANPIQPDDLGRRFPEREPIRTADRSG